MSLSDAGGRRAAIKATSAVLIALLFVAAIEAAFAQSSPFGAPRPAAPPAGSDGVIGWILAKQAEFYRGLSGAIRAAKADGSALWGLDRKSVV